MWMGVRRFDHTASSSTSSIRRVGALPPHASASAAAHRLHTAAFTHRGSSTGGPFSSPFTRALLHMHQQRCNFSSSSAEPSAPTPTPQPPAATPAPPQPAAGAGTAAPRPFAFNLPTVGAGGAPSMFGGAPRPAAMPFTLPSATPAAGATASTPPPPLAFGLPPLPATSFALPSTPAAPAAAAPSFALPNLSTPPSSSPFTLPGLTQSGSGAPSAASLFQSRTAASTAAAVAAAAQTPATPAAAAATADPTAAPAAAPSATPLPFLSFGATAQPGAAAATPFGGFGGFSSVGFASILNKGNAATSGGAAPAGKIRLGGAEAATPSKPALNFVDFLKVTAIHKDGLQEAIAQKHAQDSAAAAKDPKSLLQQPSALEQERVHEMERTRVKRKAKGRVSADELEREAVEEEDEDEDEDNADYYRTAAESAASKPSLSTDLDLSKPPPEGGFPYLPMAVWARLRREQGLGEELVEYARYTAEADIKYKRAQETWAEIRRLQAIEQKKADAIRAEHQREADLYRRQTLAKMSPQERRAFLEEEELRAQLVAQRKAEEKAVEAKAARARKIEEEDELDASMEFDRSSSGTASRISRRLLKPYLREADQKFQDTSKQPLALWPLEARMGYMEPLEGDLLRLGYIQSLREAEIARLDSELQAQQQTGEEAAVHVKLRAQEDRAAVEEALKIDAAKLQDMQDQMTSLRESLDQTEKLSSFGVWSAVEQQGILAGVSSRELSESRSHMLAELASLRTQAVTPAGYWANMQQELRKEFQADDNKLTHVRRPRLSREERDLEARREAERREDERIQKQRELHIAMEEERKAERKLKKKQAQLAIAEGGDNNLAVSEQAVYDHDEPYTVDEEGNHLAMDGSVLLSFEQVEQRRIDRAGDDDFLDAQNRTTRIEPMEEDYMDEDQEEELDVDSLAFSNDRGEMSNQVLKDYLYADVAEEARQKKATKTKRSTRRRYDDDDLPDYNRFDFEDAGDREARRVRESIDRYVENNAEEIAAGNAAAAAALALPAAGGGGGGDGGDAKKQKDNSALYDGRLEAAATNPEVEVHNIQTLASLAGAMCISLREITAKLRELDLSARGSSGLVKEDVARLLVEEFGFTPVKSAILQPQELASLRRKSLKSDQYLALPLRAPVICVMGHVDHGKTTLLDRLRSENRAAGEAGGITQAIGAFRVNLNPEGGAEAETLEAEVEPTPAAAEETKDNLDDVESAEDAELRALLEAEAAEAKASEALAKASSLVSGSSSAAPHADRPTFATFLDTPGHAAFKGMRAKGASSSCTDLVILVISAVDGLMPQTLEVIQLARKANLPLIIAINKCDVSGADPTAIQKQLFVHDVVVEDMGGEVLSCNISAKTGAGIPQLKELIAVTAEILQLHADRSCPAEAYVIESRIHKKGGCVASILVRNGSLRVGQYFVCGLQHGRVRALHDERDKPIKGAINPGEAAQLFGLKSLDDLTEDLYIVDSEAQALSVIAERTALLEADESELIGDVQAQNQADQKAQAYKIQVTRRRKRVAIRPLNSEEQSAKAMVDAAVPVLVKADVSGSLEVLLDYFAKLPRDEVICSIIKSGLGEITTADVEHAAEIGGGATIFGFNVKPSSDAVLLAKQRGIKILHHPVIYSLWDDIRDTLSERLPTEMEELSLGAASVQQLFPLTGEKKKKAKLAPVLPPKPVLAPGVDPESPEAIEAAAQAAAQAAQAAAAAQAEAEAPAMVAGCRVKVGKLDSKMKFRVKREEDTVLDDLTCVSLRINRDVKPLVEKGAECGIRLSTGFDSQIRVGDSIECYTMVRKKKVLDDAAARGFMSEGDLDVTQQAASYE